MKKQFTKKIDWDIVDAIPEENYDYFEAPELTQEFLQLATVRKPHHKKSITIRLDDDIIEFFKHHNKQYQTKINDVLRAYKIALEKTQKKSSKVEF